MFRGRFGAFLAILILAGVAVLAARLDPMPAVLGGLARASDGDSFRLGDERVRLLGIDAPELDQTCTDAAGRDWSCGREASRRLAALLAAGSVNCAPDGHDQYGRILASCSVRGADIARTMVEEGLAVSSGDYFGEEGQARRAGKGIWAGSFDSPKAWRDLQKGVMPWDWIFELLQ